MRAPDITEGEWVHAYEDWKLDQMEPPKDTCPECGKELRVGQWPWCKGDGEHGKQSGGWRWGNGGGR